MSKLLEARELCAFYGATQALFGLSPADVRNNNDVIRTCPGTTK